VAGLGANLTTAVILPCGAQPVGTGGPDLQRIQAPRMTGVGLIAVARLVLPVTSIDSAPVCAVADPGGGRAGGGCAGGGRSDSGGGWSDGDLAATAGGREREREASIP
jgi:uncharacterized membrane protein